MSYRLAIIARTDFQGHPRSMIFILSERAYATYRYYSGSLVIC